MLDDLGRLKILQIIIGSQYNVALKQQTKIF